MKLVAATRNRKKLDEIRRLLDGLDVMLCTPDDFPGCPEVEEDAGTFEVNAAKKAAVVAGYTKNPAFSDDSGLEVYALNNAPGVYSARYAGEDADDRKNFERLLKEMDCIDDFRRDARFVSVIAFALPDGSVKTFEGAVEGSIGRSAKGSNGFGYDPVFYPKGYNITFAEMSGEEKDRISHRGIALRKFIEYLESLVIRTNEKE